jgi:hypothetical protein
MKTKENLEAGMYFKFKKTFRSYTDDVYNIDTSKDGFMTLHRHHIHSKTGEYIPTDLVVVRRIGENSLDYYKHDMFGKKTRGRIHYDSIDSFFYIKQDVEGKAYTKIEKCPIPGIHAIAV